MATRAVAILTVLTALALAGPLPSALAALPGQPVRAAVAEVRQSAPVQAAEQATRPVTSHPAVQQVREPVREAATQAAATVQQTRSNLEAAVAPRPAPAHRSTPRPHAKRSVHTGHAKRHAGSGIAPRRSLASAHAEPSRSRPVHRQSISAPRSPAHAHAAHQQAARASAGHGGTPPAPGGDTGVATPAPGGAAAVAAMLLALLALMAPRLRRRLHFTLPSLTPRALLLSLERPG